LTESELRICFVCHYYSRALADLGSAATSLASVAERDATQTARGESINVISRLSPLASLVTPDELAQLSGVRETRGELKLPTLMARPAYQFTLKTKGGSFEPVSSILLVRDALSRGGQDAGRLANAIGAISKAYPVRPNMPMAEVAATTSGLRAGGIHRGPTDQEIRQVADARFSSIKRWFGRNS